jgi:hypothetical protein
MIWNDTTRVVNDPYREEKAAVAAVRDRVRDRNASDGTN